MPPILASRRSATGFRPGVWLPCDLRTLKAGGLLRLRVTAPSELCCLSGRVWITCEGRCEDIVLDRNERRALGKESRVLVEALTDAVIELRREPGAMR